MSKAINVNERDAQMLIELLSIKIEERTPFQINQVKGCLSNVKFLKQYNETADYNEVIKNLELEIRNQDYILFKQGDPADKFYIILSGQIGLYINIKDVKEKILGQGVREVAKLGAGDCFGELGLLFNEDRTATAVCLQPTKLLSLNKATFDKYLSNAKNEKLDVMTSFYRNLWIFRSLSSKEILKLSTKTTISKCVSNTIIIRQGEKPKGIFFVRNGIVKIIQTIKFKVDPRTQEILDDYRDPTEQQIKLKQYRTIDMELDEIGNGSYFCDYEIFNDQEVQYSAICITQCDILTTTDQDLQSSIPKAIYQEMKENVKYYSKPEKIKKQFIENLMWKNFKQSVILHFNHQIVNQKRLNQTRVPLLSKIDLAQFNIYDDVREEQEMIKKENLRQSGKLKEDTLTNLNSQLEANLSSQHKQTTNLDSKSFSMVEGQDLINILNQKQAKAKKKVCAVTHIQKKIRQQQQLYQMNQKKQTSRETAPQDNYQLWMGNKQAQSQKHIFPKINTKSPIFGLVNQIY